MVNTLELRGIDAYSPEIQTFVREIEQSFLQVLNNCVPADLPVTQLDIPMTMAPEPRYCKKIQRNFWVGIYYPNVYDNLEFIPLP